jgi:hypothetical protein
MWWPDNGSIDYKIHKFPLQNPHTLFCLAVKQGKENEGQFNKKTHSSGIGHMDVVEALLPYRNATKIFLSVFYLEKIFHT